MIVGRDLSSVAGNGTSSDSERFARDEFDGFVIFQFAGANFWTGKIDEHCYRSPEFFGRFFFKNSLKSFSWGLLTTAAIRSSTITTSVVVPIVAKKVANLGQAAPFIMGANVGTTITAFIAATLNAHAASAISIAIAHFLFNLIGVMLFFPIPVLRRLPLERLPRGELPCE